MPASAPAGEWHVSDDIRSARRTRPGYVHVRLASCSDTGPPVASTTFARLDMLILRNHARATRPDLTGSKLSGSASGNSSGEAMRRASLSCRLTGGFHPARPEGRPEGLAFICGFPRNC